VRSQEVRALLVSRLQNTLKDVELSIRGILRGFGLKVGEVTRKKFESRIRQLVTGHAMVERIADAMLSARAELLIQFNKLDKSVGQIARYDKVCLQFMTVPSVGPLTAITYKSAIDDPQRIKKSKSAGPLFGLTPRKYQSGETGLTGGITRVGDEILRTALYEAANSLFSPKTRFSALKRWGPEVAQRRSLKRARKLAVILHRLCVDGTPFRWSTHPARSAIIGRISPMFRQCPDIAVTDDWSSTREHDRLTCGAEARMGTVNDHPAIVDFADADTAEFSESGIVRLLRATADHWTSVARSADRDEP
jgi:hypothetical protein